MLTLEDIGARAANAKRVLACAGSQKKDEALKNIARALIDRQQEILNANGADVRNGEQAGLTPALLDRLRLDDKRMRDMADSVLKVADMEDPLGKILSGSSRPNGLKIRKITVPLGVIAIIYEARPNVSSDAATLCLKAGNAVILRGGKEALQSNKAITACMRRAVEDAGLPADCIQLVEDTSRESAAALMRLNAYVDVLIPRGGAGLINAVVQNSTVPVIETGVGNCHIYVDTAADIDMAANIVYNAKTSRPSVCNACESLLIHKDIAEMALLAIAARLNEKQVEVRGDEAVCAILPEAVPAREEDWGEEYLDYILSAKVVADAQEAIDHIARYGSGHSECIVTDDYAAAQRFLDEVDAAAVYVNASTRFTDGGEFGFGAEIGISTQKLHARGPLGLSNLTSEKYIIYGSGQIR